MTTNIVSIKDIYDHLLRVISSNRFLKKQGLGNEIPFFICPYTSNRSGGNGAKTETVN